MRTPAEDGGRSRLPPAVRVVGGVSVVLFWLVLALLLVVVGLPLADGLLLTILLVAVPGLSLAQLPLIAGASLERLPAYWSSIVTLWLLGSGSWLVGTREGGWAALGVVSIPWLPASLWSTGLAAAGLVTIVVFRQLGLWTGRGESPVLRQLLPRTREERMVFAALAVAAGFGEELAYRGYALGKLSPLLGVPGAVVATSVVFGVLHGYQGTLGILRTTVMGGMLAWGFLAAGSLWPAIVAHTAIDLVAGLLLGERLMSPHRSPGVRGAPGGSPVDP